MDKGYNDKALCEHIEQTEICNNNLRKRIAKYSNDHMKWELYKTFYLVENAFVKLKQYGRLPQDLISSSRVMRIRPLWLAIVSD